MIDLNDVRPISPPRHQPHLATSELAARLNERVADLARTLLGEPNRNLSNRSQLRFGNKGSIAVEINGAERGRWYDHENGVGGDGLNLVSQTLGLANGAACDWSIEWLGLDHPASQIRGPDADRLDEPEVAAPADDKAAKVAGIVASCEAPEGTCVETYLSARGIRARPLPPCIRYRPNAYGRYAALVALSTDAAGAVQAVQQIYLTSDGRKAPVKVQKRTNKARDDWSDLAAVRLPGTSPIVLTEGVETALSVWQATGYETWACLGIGNIARAPVPDGVPVVVARDGDEAGSKADNQIRQAITILRGQGRQVGVAEPPPGKDFNDVLVEEGEQGVRARIQALVSADLYSTSWRAGLLYNDEGEPRPILANAIHALRRAPEWDGVLWHNEFATTTVARKPPPWAAGVPDWEEMTWSDRDDYLVAEWLQRQGIMAPASVAGQAVETIARDRTFHPVREYLDRLQWDGHRRLELWLTTYLGVVEAPYTRAVGARWLMSAAARIYVPGAKADCVLILEGPQGIKKSSALMTLAEPWFTDRLSDLGSKDAAMETKGVWIIEVAELDSMSRTEVGAIKAFISRTHDRFRPPYGKRLVDLPRQCVFAGSVNPEGGYLKDATGGRRFWPVLCTTIDVERLRTDRDQLWAEARDRFRAGEPWWLESRELNAAATEEQDDRYQGDAWADPIRQYLECEVQWSENRYGERKPYHVPRPEPLNDTSVAEVLEHALGIERGRWSQVDQNRVVRCLVSRGFKRRKVRRNGEREWRYLRDPDTRSACGSHWSHFMTGWSHYAPLEKPRETAAWSHWSQWSHLFPSVFVGAEKRIVRIHRVKRESRESYPYGKERESVAPLGPVGPPQQDHGLSRRPYGTTRGTTGTKWDHPTQPEQDLMQTSMAADEDRVDHEQAIRASLQLLRRNRSPGAAQRLEEARDASARAWGHRRGLIMARPGSEWWRLLRRRSRGPYPDRLPGDDHVSLWLRERKPEVYVSQPYGLTSDVAAEMLGAAELYGLRFTISTWPAWWNPGAVLFVEWRRAERP